MAPNLLAALTASGVLRRSHDKRALLVTPRFLAHVEGTAGRMRTLGHVVNGESVAGAALRTWPLPDAEGAAAIVADMLGEQAPAHTMGGGMSPVWA